MCILRGTQQHFFKSRILFYQSARKTKRTDIWLVNLLDVTDVEVISFHVSGSIDF